VEKDLSEGKIGKKKEESEAAKNIIKSNGVL